MPRGAAAVVVKFAPFFVFFPMWADFWRVVSVSGDVVARARAALESVEPGVWEVEEYRETWSREVSYSLVGVERFRQYRNNVGCGQDGALARFVADAHNVLVPELVAAVDRVRALHWPSESRDPACDCYDGLSVCPTVAALGGVS